MAQSVNSSAASQRQPIIPTFIDNMPPSPTKRQPTRMTTASTASNQIIATRPAGAVATPIPVSSAQLPSVVVEQSAEDERLSAVSTTQMQWYQMPHTAAPQQAITMSTTRVNTSSESSAERPVQSQPVYVQVMLQLGGTQQQIPINIPADIVVPALLSSLTGTNKTFTAGVGGSTPSTPSAVFTGAPQSIPRTPSVGEIKQAVTAIDQSKKHPLSLNHGSNPGSPMASTSFPKMPRLSGPATTPVNSSPTPAMRYTNLQTATVASPPAIVHRQSSLSAVSTTKRELSSESDEDSKKSQQTNNRAAASRCRQKKKQQIDEMEKKAKKLQDANKQLEDEMRELKKEIVDYESVLALHSDCLAVAQQNVYYVATA